MAVLNENSFLQAQCFRVNLSKRVIELCAPFSCGNQDLDDFFASDYASYSNQLLGKTYAFVEPGQTNNIVCAFTVSNASIFTNYLPNARKKKVGKDIPTAKRDLIYPAVLIGRLGVNVKYKRHHIGSELMYHIKEWFVEPTNKTGCRYLVVDAYNESTPLEYYLHNGFNFMFSTEEQEKEYRKVTASGPLHTRLMYFDLMQIVSATTPEANASAA